MLRDRGVSFAISLPPVLRTFTTSTCSASLPSDSPSPSPVPLAVPRAVSPAASSAVRLDVIQYLDALHVQHKQLLHSRRLSPQLFQFLSDFNCFLQLHYPNHPPLPPSLTVPTCLRLLHPAGFLAKPAIQLLSQPNPSVPQPDPNYYRPHAQRILQNRHQDLAAPLFRRNAYWMAIPYAFARSHPFAVPLPSPASIHFDHQDTLRKLRHDSNACHSAVNLASIRPRDVWAFLALSERMNRHDLTLAAWKHMVHPVVPARAFLYKFQIARRANAILVYAEAHRAAWKSAHHHPSAAANAVQIFEEGLYVGADAFSTVVAAPVATVLERNERDFWMWNERPHLALLVHALPVFRATLPAQCKFQLFDPTDSLPHRAFVEAQFVMACCDLPFTDVMQYATLGRSKIFRVKRCDSFLEEATSMIKWFERQFVYTCTPPQLGFQHQYEKHTEVWRLVDQGVAEVQTVFDLDAEQVEIWLAPWRERLNEWQIKRSENPFF